MKVTAEVTTNMTWIQRFEIWELDELWARTRAVIGRTDRPTDGCICLGACRECSISDHSLELSEEIRELKLIIYVSDKQLTNGQFELKWEYQKNDTEGGSESVKNKNTEQNKES